MREQARTAVAEKGGGLNNISNEQMKHQISPPKGLIFCTSTL